MGNHISFTDNKTGEKEILSLGGANEMLAITLPLCESLGLQFWTYMFSAGLRIDCDPETQKDFIKQADILLNKLEQRFEFEADIANILYRYRRCRKILGALEQGSIHEVYIG